MELKYSEILRRNSEFSRNLPDEKYEIAVLSNVIISQAKDIIEYALRIEEVPALVTIGDYDNIVQDSLRYKDADLVLIFWETYNIIDGLHFKIELFNETQVDDLFEKTTAELDFVFRNLKDVSLVLINTFTALPFSGLHASPTNLDKLSDRLNHYLKGHAPANVKLIDTERIMGLLGISASIDLRYFYSSKAPYTIDFFKTYSRAIQPYVNSANGKSKKAVIFDCDNTLWKGVIGEDGHDGIQMSSATKDGAIFAEVQSIALSLNRRGIILGLCSKNNVAEVEEVIKSHPDIQIKDEHIAVKRINWRDKVSNLKEIAQELNIGLDALVVVDDSPFEVNLIKEQLPQVTVLQVPSGLHLYPKMIRDSLGLFFSLSSTNEDAEKNLMYKEQATRQSSKDNFQDLESYLVSLGTKMTIYEDERAIIPRMAQLTQKTNQFNLTTRRYTESDIASLVESERTKVFAFGISDKFGDSGITGLCIVKIEPRDIAVIDSLLMSCRVLGRNVEYAFMDWLIQYLKRRGITEVRATYLSTLKNIQVKEFLDRCSFSLIDFTETARNYSLVIEHYKSKPVEYVEIIDGR